MRTGRKDPLLASREALRESLTAFQRSMHDCLEHILSDFDALCDALETLASQAPTNALRVETNATHSSSTYSSREMANEATTVSAPSDASAPVRRGRGRPPGSKNKKSSTRREQPVVQQDEEDDLFDDTFDDDFHDERKTSSDDDWEREFAEEFADDVDEDEEEVKPAPRKRQARS